MFNLDTYNGILNIFVKLISKYLVFMCIYTYISILFLFLLFIEFGIQDLKSSKFLFYIGAIILILLLGLRSEEVGPDTLNYIKFFDGTGTYYGSYYNPNPDIELGIIYLARLVRTFSTDFRIWLMVTSIMTIVPFLYLVNIGSRVRMIPLILVIANVYNVLYLAMAAMRQNLSLGFILLAFITYYMKDFPKKEKIIKTVCFFTIAVLFHQTALLALPFMILCACFSFKRFTLIIMLISSLVIAFMISGHAYSLFQTLNVITSIWGFSERYFNYDKDAFGTSISLLYLAPMTLYTIINVLCCDKNEVKNVRVKYLVLGCILFNLGSSLTVIMRVVYPLIMIGITYIPMHILDKKQLIYKWSILAMLFLFAFLVYRTCSKMTNFDNNGIYPYTFFWEI